MRKIELEDRLKGHVKITKSIISAPFDLKTEINKMEEKDMVKPKNITWIKRFGTIAAVVTLCIMTVVCANPIKGFFKDIMRWDGAIVGTEYINATNDLKITASEMRSENGNTILSLEIAFENKNEAPFSFIQEIAIADFKILDRDSKEILVVSESIEESVKGTIKDGKVLIDLPIGEAKLNTNDKYFIVIDSIHGLAKAEQSLKINGTWKCEF